MQQRFAVLTLRHVPCFTSSCAHHVSARLSYPALTAQNVDVARPPRKKTGRNVAIGVGVLALVLVSVALSRLKPAAPTVDGATILTDSVRRGDLTRDVRGPGTLVPEQIRWITAQSSAR